jgi:hypothetical protein
MTIANGNLPEHKFSSHLQELVALITYLSCTTFRSRRAKPLAKDLGLDEGAVRRTLEAFPAFFRQSRRTDDSGEHFWTTQLRFALRPGESDDPDAETEPLRPDEVAPTLAFISEMVAQEQESGRLSRELATRYTSLLRTTRFTLAAAVLAALAALARGLLDFVKP